MSESYTPEQLVLVAESDDQLLADLERNLCADGYAVTVATNRRHLHVKLASERPAVMLLGELADAPVVALLSEVRGGPPDRPADPDLPILCLGPEGDELAELRALRAGADDHVRKPLSYPVVHARVEALLRRRARRPGGRLRLGRLEVHLADRWVSVDGKPLTLTNLEYQLLVRLASEPTKLWTKRELLRDVWGYRTETRTVDSHACRLREKLHAAGADRHVINVWGVGYRLLDPVTAPEHNGAA